MCVEIEETRLFVFYNLGSSYLGAMCRDKFRLQWGVAEKVKRMLYLDNLCCGKAPIARFKSYASL